MNKDTTEYSAAQAAHRANPLARAGRMVVCVLSLGMLYPHAFSESVNYEENEAKIAADAKKQQAR